jgi:hypothetical protein
MKHIIFLVLFSLFSNVYTQEQKKDEFTNCTNIRFETNQAQADSIVEFYEKAQKTDGEEKIELENKFFCSFPNSFSEMESIFSWDSKLDKAGVLMDYSGGKNDEFMSEPLIYYFSNLKSIDVEEYYDKYISICTNGYWQADNIREGFYIYKRFINDTENACREFLKKDEDVIYSVFKFIFDGPHPDNEDNKEILQTIYPLIKEESTRLANILMKSYDIVIKDNKH